MDVKFKVQVRLSLLVVVFCMVSIFSGKTESAYLSMLSGILGYWLPSPNQTEPIIKPKRNEIT